MKKRMCWSRNLWPLRSLSLVRSLRNNTVWGLVVSAFILFASSLSMAAGPRWKQATADDDGVYHLPPFSIPPSDLSSEEAQQRTKVEARQKKLAKGIVPGGKVYQSEEILELRSAIDAELKRQAENVLRVYPVSVTSQLIGGVQAAVVTPKNGVSPKNANRVLINLHAGSMTWGSRYGGQIAAAPIAALGSLKVVAVDYRLAPEHRFPAASEDVANVYEALLTEYRAENIGIYGCSAGGRLTANSVAYFQVHGLPAPGAISMDGSGAVTGGGDSSYFAGAYYSGIPPYPPVSSESQWDWSNWIERDPYFRGADPESPLVSPANHPDVLAKFPPTLIINSTRDPGMSTAAYTHTQLIKAGVDADLHIWEGVGHCFSADPGLPESREAYDVLTRFFDRHLGQQPRTR